MVQEATVNVIVKPGNQSLTVPAGTRLEDLAKEFVTPETGVIVAAMVDNRLLDLHTTLDSDCTVEFVDLRSTAGQRIYQRSAVMILLKATQDVLPGAQVSIEHSLSNGLYGEIHWSSPIGPGGD